MPIGFIGRKKELLTLQNLHKREGSHIAVVYGRRRVGKTELIRRAFSNQLYFSFEGLENRGKREQIRNFIFQLELQTKKEIKKTASITAWREAFALLLPYIEGKTAVILLDELQWMANYRNDLISDLKMIWDQHLSQKSKCTLVLCGSIASFMEKKVVKSTALYGRTDLSIKLSPFKIHETVEFFPERSFEEILLAQLIVGGIPKYLSLLAKEESILRGIQRLTFLEGGYFWDEYERIFVSHFGHSDKYEAIINTLGDRPFGLSRKELLYTLGAQGGGDFSKILYNLESAGFISAFVPFHKKKNSRLVRYVLTDPFLKFNKAFLETYKKLSNPNPNYFLQHIFPSPKFSSWLGGAFEVFCFNHAHEIARILEFSGIQYNAGPYFRHSSKGALTGVQVDLIFARADKVITLCEAKYSNQPIGIGVLEEFNQKINAIPEIQEKTVQRILLTNRPATKELEKSGLLSIICAKELSK